MSLEFIRFGGLSKVNYKKAVKHDTYHSPPMKKGIYAFIFPYIEDFLWVWKLQNVYVKDKMKKIENTKYENFSSMYRIEYKRLRKKFKYNGMIWTHFVDESLKQGIGIQYKKNWVQVHTDDLEMLLKKDKHIVNRESDDNFLMIDPYKRGLGGYYSRDHLEVFIEKVN